jgi:hypothetical protein
MFSEHFSGIMIFFNGMEVFHHCNIPLYSRKIAGRSEAELSSNPQNCSNTHNPRKIKEVTMAEVSMSMTLNTPASEVWKTISDFNGLPNFVAAIATSTTEGSGVGAQRTLTLQEGGPPIIERLESFDEKARTLSYSIVESPLPLENYVSTMQVRELSKNSCEITWLSTFEPKGVPEAEAKKIVEGVYSTGFEGLKKLHGC